MLVAGMTLILAAAVALSASGLFDEDRPQPRAPLLAARVITAAKVIARLPPALRAEAAASLDTPALGVRWAEAEAAAPPLRPDPFADRLERRLRRALRSADIAALSVGHPVDGGEPGLLVLRITFPDGTRLEFQTEREGPAAVRLLRYLAPLLLVGVGLIALAALVARWVTAPLGRFAAAAERLGRNVEAPPLPETGPDEIRRAAQAFNRMQQRIRRFVEERLHVLAAASHDLRTPITRLRLRAEFVEDEAERLKMLKDLEEMEAILRSTIAYVREETASEPSEPVELSALLAEVVADLRAAGRTATLDAAAPVTIQGRPVALKRAFANLAGNAAVYGGRAGIRLGCDRGRAVVTIEDDGPGIPEPEMEKVFAPFYRLERSRSRETGGTGLGLSVARTVIRAHGGEIELANRPEGGLWQRVVLPAP